MADIQFSYFSPMMGRYVHVTGIIPFDFTANGMIEPPYKSIYFLSGYGMNAAAMHAYSVMTQESYYNGYAMFMVDGENSFYVDRPSSGAFYEKYVAEELVDITRKLFPISKKREDTYIGGISMGGYGALMIGSRHMDTFSKIIAMSPVANPYQLTEVPSSGFTKAQMDYIFGSVENYAQNYDPLNVLLKAQFNGMDIPDIFLCCGEQDPLVFQMDKSFVEEAEKNGIPIEAQWGEGAHETRYWNQMLPQASDFIIKK